MKQCTSMARLTGQLEKMFRALNADFFNNELDTPIITVTPTSRAYAHYTPWNAWDCKGEGRREINISSGYLSRPLEAIVCSLLHEMCHQFNDTISNVQDTSRNGTFHNKHFAAVANTHGLICTKTDNYGWAKTDPSDELIEWLLLHDELREIEICRVSPGAVVVGGTRGTSPTATRSVSTTYRLTCPCCRSTVRASRPVNILCGDCLTAMVTN